MARGGFRPGAGRPVGTTKKAPQAKAAAKPTQKAKIQAKQKVLEKDQSLDLKNTEWKTPLDYMMSILNDPTVDESRRDRLAIAAAPFVHARAGESSKKEERTKAAKKVSGGKFAPVAPPLRLVS